MRQASRFRMRSSSCVPSMPLIQMGNQYDVTDDHGLVRLPPQEVPRVLLTVMAKGWMPDSRIVDVPPKMGTIDFRLQPGRKLKIRCVDSSGAPVPEVSVRLERWRRKTFFESVRQRLCRCPNPPRSQSRGTV